jgi:heptosyltransferase-2
LKLNSAGLAKPSPDSSTSPRLLAIELWGLGDLALALPFLRTASTHARVILLAKPEAAALLARFAPAVEHIPLTAPWTAFRGKYRLQHWPWEELKRVLGSLRQTGFDVAVSARPDPRDHLLMRLAGARRRVGFARAGSGLLLSDRLVRPARAHRAEYWRSIAATLNWPEEPVQPPPVPRSRHVILHSGAGQPTKAWPLDRYAALARRIRAREREVRILCDRDQLDAWRALGESAAAPPDVGSLLSALDGAGAFVGNDSGPGHLAAALGVPTFTLFGNQFATAFAPVHPRAQWIEGSPCPYKPCYDSCRFAQPNCLYDITLDAAWLRIAPWLDA